MKATDHGWPGQLLVSCYCDCRGHHSAQFPLCIPHICKKVKQLQTFFPLQDPEVTHATQQRYTLQSKPSAQSLSGRHGGVIAHVFKHAFYFQPGDAARALGSHAGLVSYPKYSQ